MILFKEEVMSEQESEYKVQIKDGSGWSAGKAVTLVIGGKKDKEFANNWDRDVPLSQDWRKLAEIKIQ